MSGRGLDGFLGTRSPLGYELAFLLELAIIPLFLWSLQLLLVRRDYVAHKRLQLLVTGIFLVASVCFLIAAMDTDWRLRSGYGTFQEIPRIVQMTYLLHVFSWAVTAGIWLLLLVTAAKNVPNPPVPCDFGPYYVFWTLVLALFFFVTTITGWEFYLLAFCF